MWGVNFKERQFTLNEMEAFIFHERLDFPLL